MRHLGIDYGDQNIGLAISDETEIIASPLKTLKNTSIEKVGEKIKEICNNNNIGYIILGNPIDINKQETTQTQKIKAFKDKLKKTIGIPIKLWDETNSSLIAEKILIQQNYPKTKRKSLNDETAAAVILQQYLDNKKE